MKRLLPFLSLIITTYTYSSLSIITMVPSTMQILSLSLLAQKVKLEEVTEEDTHDAIDWDDLDDELLPTPDALIGQYPHDFFLSPGFSSRSSRHNYAEQALSRGDKFGGDTNLAHQAADRAQAAEQAQHGAAAKAALVAAFRLAEEAKGAAKEAEAVAAAKQYHAAHLSSAAQGAQGRAFAEAAFSAKVSKVLHAAEGQQKQSKQQAELLKSAAYAAQSLADQSGYVTEALRHLFSAQKAAALESKDNAKKLSLQQQDALERLSQAQAAANKAHAAAAAALANVHKNGIYGGGDESLFGTTSEEEYEAKISYHTDHQHSYQDGSSPGQEHTFQSEPGTYQTGSTAPRYEEHPVNSKVSYPSVQNSPHYEELPSSGQGVYQEGGSLSSHKRDQDLTIFQHDHLEASQGPVNYPQNTRNFPTPSQVSFSNSDNGALFPHSLHGQGSISGQMEINDAATERLFEHGSSRENNRVEVIYPNQEKDQIEQYGVNYLEEGEVLFDHGGDHSNDWSSSYGKQLSDDSTYAFSNPKEILRNGLFYEKDEKINYSRQVDYGGKRELAGVQDGLEGVSMSKMKGKPFIVNGDGSDLVFMKTGTRDNKNMAVPATKYSQVPEGLAVLAMRGRSGEVSLPKAPLDQERDSGSEAEENTSDLTEEREKKHKSSTRGPRGGGGRRKLRVFKEKIKSATASSEKRKKVQANSGEKRADVDGSLASGEVLDPPVNTR